MLSRPPQLMMFFFNNKLNSKVNNIYLTLFLENTIIRMMNENDKAMLTLKRENQKKLNDLVHQLAMEEIGLEKMKVQTETEQRVSII